MLERNYEDVKGESYVGLINDQKKMIVPALFNAIFIKNGKYYGIITKERFEGIGGFEGLKEIRAQGIEGKGLYCLIPDKSVEEKNVTYQCMAEGVVDYIVDDIANVMKVITHDDERFNCGYLNFETDAFNIGFSSDSEIINGEYIIDKELSEKTYCICSLSQRRELKSRIESKEKAIKIVQYLSEPENLPSVEEMVEKCREENKEETSSKVLSKALENLKEEIWCRNEAERIINAENERVTELRDQFNKNLDEILGMEKENVNEL